MTADRMKRYTGILTKTQLIKEIERHKKAIAKERDALRDLVSDAGEVLDASERADEALNEAIDVLSEHL